MPPTEDEMKSYRDLREVVARLRAPDGCPWDREQTHDSLRPYIIREAYEVLAALDEGVSGHMRDELGDLLFQVLLDWGVDLTLPIAKEEIHSKDVFFVDQNALAACFDDGVSEDLIKELAARQPLRVVFRDSGFASDDAKINAEQIFKQMSPGTEVRSI